jgi:hypothetical protein
MVSLFVRYAAYIVKLNIGITSVRNKVFYCALLTLHVSAPFGGHLKVVRNKI